MMISFILEIRNRGFLEHLLFSYRFFNPNVENRKSSFTLRGSGFGFSILTLICVCFFILDFLLDQSTSLDQIDQWSQLLLVLSHLLSLIYWSFTMFLLFFTVCITIVAPNPNEELFYCPLMNPLHFQLVSDSSSSPFCLRDK